METTSTGQVEPPKRQAKGLRRTFVALRHRNFRLFWFGQLVSLIGEWMQTIGQAWLVLELTKSAWALGVLGAVQFQPVLVLAPFGGVFADRWPKRRMLVLTQSWEMLLALILWALVLTGTVQVWQIYVLALLLGLTNSLDLPTRQAFMIEMVGREDLPNAVALNSSLFPLGMTVGPGLGGLLIAALGVAPLFLLNGLSFLGVIVGLALINSHELHAQVKLSTQGEQANTWQSLREGLDYVWHTPSILLVTLVVGAVALFGLNFEVLWPLFATEVLKIGAVGFGFLSSAFGIGSLLSALWLAWDNRRPSIRRVLIGSLAFSVLEMTFAISHIAVLSLGLSVMMGFTVLAFTAMASTTLQTVAPNQLRGRVMSVYTGFLTGSVPLGNLLTGWLATAFGASKALFVCALLSFMAAVTGWVWRKPAEKDLTESARF